MAKTGRPRVEINWDEFDKLCSIHCTELELAAWFKCSVDTIHAAVKRDKSLSFPEYYRQKSGPGKISLRRKQWELALKGDKTMIIWLGKQHLGQSDKADQNIQHSGPDGKPIKIEALNFTTTWRALPDEKK